MSYYRLFYHIIWTTKQRQPLICDDNETSIYSAIRERVDKLGGMVHAANGMPDHVHLVVTLPPTITIANAVGQIKGSSSFVANRLSPQADPFTWQQEFGVLSVSESHLPTIV